jgi:hypothetical protein
LEKVAQNVGCLYNYLKTGQSKQSPIGRKFAQSGHATKFKIPIKTNYSLVIMNGNLRNAVFSVEESFEQSDQLYVHKYVQRRNMYLCTYLQTMYVVHLCIS